MSEARVVRERVFPTCVGVDRLSGVVHSCFAGIPHVRGGGPSQICNRTSVYPYSPRAWGWTDLAKHKAQWLQVFPTCVGVDRSVK